MLELVKKENTEGIWVGNMKDGDIGVIIEWGSIIYCLGRIVQRYGNDLISIGMPSGDSWRVLTPSRELSSNCRVRLLKKDEVLVVV